MSTTPTDIIPEVEYQPVLGDRDFVLRIMSMAEQGLMIRGRLDRPLPAMTSAEQSALADFHRRTDFQFNQVQDRSLIGAYARQRGWEWIADVLLPQSRQD